MPLLSMIRPYLERWLYVGDDRHIIERYVAGRVVPSPKG